jgi:RNA polymerase sigma-70 factor (sigma-E family)
MTAGRDDEFQDYVRHKRGMWLRTASMLTSGDLHLAEDVVQIALTRLYLAWPRARRMNVDAYLRRILVNALVDEKRRPFVRRENSRAAPPERRIDDGHQTAEGDEQLLSALASLPPGMRAAVVLRHIEDLSVEETADALGCSSGTVKSQTARGLEKLREQLADRPQSSPTKQGATQCQN